MDVVCTSRIPEFFLITVLTSAGSVLKESNVTHEPGQAYENFTINLPSGVDACSLHVRISAGNSARISSPSEAVEVGKSQFSNLLGLKCKKVNTNMFTVL